MIDDAEYLERVVRGITALSLPSAIVERNVILGGRQFDVVARFSLGAHNFLLVIEVRNRSRRATAEQIEAFITKGRDKHANKIVVVTKAGYQSGAIDVANAHGVELFQVTLRAGAAPAPHGAFLLTKRSAADGSIVEARLP